MKKTQDADSEVEPRQDPTALTLQQARRTTGLGAVVKRKRAVQAARQSAAQAPGSAREQGGSDPGVRTKTVVVIDDERDQVDTTLLVLQASGYSAFGSTDGSKAVDLVLEHGSEVVVLDFMLAGMTGCDVCDALRAEPRTREVRIVVLSGTPETEIRRSCIGYDVYLRKPSSTAGLLRAIEKAGEP